MTDIRRQSIRLEGGPLDGQQRQVHPTTNEFVEEWDIGPADLYPPPARKTAMATYRRANETTFRFARTQTAMGEHNRDFWVDPASNFHPYECGGPGLCIHCDRTVTADHLPHECALCRKDHKEE